VLVSSLKGKLGNWASDHSAEIYDLKALDELNAYVRVGFSIEVVEGENFYSPIRVQQDDKSLTDYTQEFNNSYAY
jgi:pyridoxine/pyridoxamine 5'-phosphate oxidase